MGFALCSSGVARRAVGRALQHPTCSGSVPWLGRPKAVLSDEQGSELDSCPGTVGGVSVKPAELRLLS